MIYINFSKFLKKNNKVFIAYQNGKKLLAKKITEDELYFLYKFKKEKHVIKILDTILYQNSYYAIFNFIENGDFLDNIYKNLDIKTLTKQLCICLKNILAKGYIYEDLKLENILLKYNKNTNQHKLLICDLEKMHLVNENIDFYRCTNGYYSPEFLLRIPFNHEKNMVWQIGVILYAYLYKEYPFDQYVIRYGRKISCNVQCEHATKKMYYEKPKDVLLLNFFENIFCKESSRYNLNELLNSAWLQNE